MISAWWVNRGAPRLWPSVWSIGPTRSSWRPAPPAAATRRVVAEVDGRLHAAADAAHTIRIRQRWFGAILTAFAASAFITDRALDRRTSANNSFFDPGLVLFATVGSIRFLDSFNDSPIERTTRLWDREPSLGGVPRFALVPVTGGGMLALAGRL